MNTENIKRKLLAIINPIETDLLDIIKKDQAFAFTESPREDLLEKYEMSLYTARKYGTPKMKGIEELVSNLSNITSPKVMLFYSETSKVQYIIISNLDISVLIGFVQFL